MNRIGFTWIYYLIYASFLVSCQGECKTKIPQEMPNIIFIMADDLGYGDLGCYGQQDIKTPNLDQLALEGMRFTNAYSGHTVCAPSRSALLTGLHTGRTLIRGNKSSKGKRIPLSDSLTILPEILKEIGYSTGIFGKWGLGEYGTTGIPNNKGFDEFYGYLNQAKAHQYYAEYLWHNNEKVYFPENSKANVINSAEWLQSQILEYIKKNRDRPFFAYYALTLPHAELKTTSKDLKSYIGLNGMSVFAEKPFLSSGSHFSSNKNPYATYAAMVSQLDRYVGEVISLLDLLSLTKETLVIFTSDNGPHNAGGYDPNYFNSNGNLRGIKRDLYEGGIKVPFIVKWSGVVKPGSTSDYVWASWDLFPTLMELIGIEKKELILSGESALDIFNGSIRRRKTPLYWETTEKMNGDLMFAIRQDDWKGVCTSLKNGIELYNLKNDLSENNNIASKHPEIVRQLVKTVKEERSSSKNWPVDTLLLNSFFKRELQ